MTEARIHRNDESREYYFQEGCHILEMENNPGDPDISIARARVAAAITTHWHALSGITERYVILQGRGLVEVGSSPEAEVTAGDVVVIPPGVRQRIKNTGTGDLLFLAICTPRFEASAYIDLEDGQTP